MRSTLFSRLTAERGGGKGEWMSEEKAQGFVQVYTGEGKGKTTAALGLAMRASGRGFRVYMGQFMKGQDYGELHALPMLKGVDHDQYGDVGWVYKGKVKPEQREMAEAGLRKGREALVSGRYRVVILDEVNMAVWFELIALEAVLELLEARPPEVELVLTGRRAAPELVERADLVTEMREIKHYYTQGVGARPGIEM
jgi:cob(I)alamin adenosyltransferase